MKEKIAIIDSLGSHGSSHHFYLYGQAKGLSENGVDIRIYTNNVTENPDYDGIKFFQFYNNIFGRKSKILSGFRYVLGSVFSLIHAKFSGVKICHFHLFHVNVLVFFDFILSKVLCMKVVYTIHDVVSLENSKSSEKLSNFIYKKADKILTHNNFSEEIFKSHYIEVNSNLDIIPHGNYIPFLNIKDDMGFSREKIGIPKDKTILLFFGMIKKVKGLELLLHALSTVVEKNPNVILVIAGRVWENDFSIYQKIIDENNLSEYCIIHNKFIPHEDVDHYYASADLVVLPYKRIYQSGVLMMSLSYEKAVLVSDLPPLIEVIDDEKNGFVFRSEDVFSLSEKLNTILDNKLKMEEVRIKASEIVKTKFGWKEIGKLTKKSYKSIL